MRWFLLAALSAPFVTPAAAADLIVPEPPAPAPIEIVAPIDTWSGLYIGGQVGGAFGFDGADTVYNPRPGYGSAFAATPSSNKSSFVGGGHIGYDYQIGNVVIGAVADINKMNGSSERSFSVGGVSFPVKDKIDYMGTVRGRLGYAYDRFLVYGTGGLAYAKRSRSTSFPTTTSGPFTGYKFSEKTDKTDTGYAVGGGIDYLVSRNMSVGLEYLYTDLGKNDWSAKATNGAQLVDFTANTNDRTDFHTVWAKMSYRFD
ncbi:MAG TPA: porin family protein [Aurantimonas coralicida]|uniref:Porin family protein n=2 Tax=root TaxID=1 RepID=A0A9C9NJD1_9HYPH|nr:porin family protein [Aurantimonas coralicida]HEU03020.1 porin family protein [Aurantimonas coralicida]